MEIMTTNGDWHRRAVPIFKMAFLMNSASYTMSSCTTLNYSVMISSVAILDIATQLKSMGDTLDSTHAKRLVKLKSRRLLKWCIRALKVLYEAIG